MVLHLPGDARERDRRFRFLGLHPYPPVSARFAARRNALYNGVAAFLSSEPRLPLLVAGDLNNSRFPRSFQEFCRRSAPVRCRSRLRRLADLAGASFLFFPRHPH
jgi:hypothetical protein